MVESDFDYASVNLGLHQEWIELELFNHGVARFSEEDFIEAGLTPEDRTFLSFMATQEADHVTLLSNSTILPGGKSPCLSRRRIVQHPLL